MSHRGVSELPPNKALNLTDVRARATMKHITTAGNTVVPAVLAWRALGSASRSSEMENGISFEPHAATKPIRLMIRPPISDW